MEEFDKNKDNISELKIILQKSLEELSEEELAYILDEVLGEALEKEEFLQEP